MPPLRQSNMPQRDSATRSPATKAKDPSLESQVHTIPALSPLTAESAALASQSDNVLGLQQAIGNRAVAQLLMRQTTSQVDGKTPTDPPKDRSIAVNVDGVSRFLSGQRIPALPEPDSKTSADGTLDIYLYRYEYVLFTKKYDWSKIGHLVIKPDLQTVKDQPKVYNYYDVVQQLNTLKLSDEELRLVLDQLRSIPEIQDHFLPLEAGPEFLRDASIERTISQLPELVKDKGLGIGGGVDDRYEFMHYMRAYLGSDENVIAHFKGIRQAKVPGEVYLHNTAASRLEEVAGELQDRMPATTVAFALRDRFRTHARQHNSKMAHPLGYALDYQAYRNPQITDDRLIELQDMEVGNATHFDLGMSYKQRRTLIQQMGQNEADPEQMSQFFSKFEKEFKRITEASAKFQNSLTEDIRQQLFQLRDQYKTLTAKIPRLEKQIKKAKPEARAVLNAEKEQCLADLEAIKTQLSTLFQPWLDKIAARKKNIETQVPNINEFPATRGELLKQIDAVKKEIARSKSEQKKKTQKNSPRIGGELPPIVITPPKDQPVDDGYLEQLNARLQQLLQMDKDYDQREHWNVLTQLQESLTSDLAFVFEKRALNPGVVQLLETGYFNPDPEPAKGENFNANKHGFNLAFMECMLRHGFDQGIAWGPGSTDPMHFELVEGVDSLPSADVVKQRLALANQKIKRKQSKSK